MARLNFWAILAVTIAVSAVVQADDIFNCRHYDECEDNNAFCAISTKLESDGKNFYGKCYSQCDLTNNGGACATGHYGNDVLDGACTQGYRWKARAVSENQVPVLGQMITSGTMEVAYYCKSNQNKPLPVAKSKCYIAGKVGCYASMAPITIVGSTCLFLLAMGTGNSKFADASAACCRLPVDTWHCINKEDKNGQPNFNHVYEEANSKSNVALPSGITIVRPQTDDEIPSIQEIKHQHQETDNLVKNEVKDPQLIEKKTEEPIDNGKKEGSNSVIIEDYSDDSCELPDIRLKVRNYSGSCENKKDERRELI